MAAKYKVGDRVIINSKLKTWTEEQWWDPNMCKCIGYEGVISNVIPDMTKLYSGCEGACYNLDPSDDCDLMNTWDYPEDCLDLIE